MTVLITPNQVAEWTRERSSREPGDNDVPVNADLSGLIPKWSDEARRVSLAKACLDQIIAAMLLLVLAPVLLVLMVLVKLTSRGPVLYRQKRVGHLGREFTILKLRTMEHDCERATGPVLWSMKRDRRVTPVGRVLRTLHLDPLPQLWNVLRGEMSLVGPRPDRPEFAAHFERGIPAYKVRQFVRPGIVCLADCDGGGPEATLESVRRRVGLDLDYISRQSLWLDLRILAATALRLVGVPSRIASRLCFVPLSPTWLDSAELSQSIPAREPHDPGTSPAFHLTAPRGITPATAGVLLKAIGGEIRIGETIYPLTQEASLHFESTGDERVRLTVDGFEGFIGEGANHEEALAAWRARMHLAFQTLARKQDFELSTEETAVWRSLSRAIDVPRYWESRPITLRRIGRVERLTPDPCVVRWFNGEVEEIPLDAFPAEFASFRPEDWFEALLERDRLKMTVRRVLDVTRTAPLERLSDDEAARFWDGLPTLDALPESPRALRARS